MDQEWVRARCAVDESGCWLWLRHVDRKGYGTARVNGSMQKAHRVSYAVFRGPIPTGLQLDHLCRVRKCVNPNHLEPVTNRANQLRGDSFTAVNAVKVQCPYGHSYVKLQSRRYCRQCHAAASLKSYHAKATGGGTVGAREHGNGPSQDG